MYKTVRHGENSLQYTILPQTEEVLNNSGLKGKGRDYSPSIHIRRSRRKSTVKYVALVIIGIIVALALASVPLYVMNGALHARRNLQEHKDGELTAAIVNISRPTGRDIVKSRKKELKTLPESVPVSKLKIDSDIHDTTSTTAPSTTSPSPTTTLTNERSTTPPWSMPALRSWKSSTLPPTLPPLPVIGAHDDIPLIGTPPNEPITRLFDKLISRQSWDKDVIIRPTLAPQSMTLSNVFKYETYTKSQYAKTDKPGVIENGAIFEDVLISTKPTTLRTQTTESTTSENSSFKDLKDTLLSVDDDEEFKESLEVDEVFSLPPLKPDYAPGVESDDVTVAKATDNAWYGARWPFVDTSSYFQWTGYSPGDNLLLPLLVAAVSSVALVLLLALAVRRRKRSYTSSAHIGKLTADLQADDNTNLLTAENPEDPEE